MLLKNKYGNSLKIDSAGINPMVASSMDPRSINYLKEKKVYCEIHNPRKIDKSFFNSSDIVFAMDTFVLLKLNQMFKNYPEKIKLFTYRHRNINIKDPYKFSKENYIKTMDDINFVIDSFNF